MNSEIYLEQIIERYRYPVNFGTLNDANVVSKDYNPSCGDVIEMQIKFNGERIEKIKFQGQGCAISKSSTDILIDLVKTKTTEDVKNLTTEEFLKSFGVELSPMRLKCALLGIKVLKTAVYTYLSEESK